MSGTHVELAALQHEISDLRALLALARGQRDGALHLIALSLEQLRYWQPHDQVAATVKASLLKRLQDSLQPQGPAA